MLFDGIGKILMAFPLCTYCRVAMSTAAALCELTKVPHLKTSCGIMSVHQDHLAADEDVNTVSCLYTKTFAVT
jgi:hypothetical protein